MKKKKKKKNGSDAVLSLFGALEFTERLGAAGDEILNLTKAR